MANRIDFGERSSVGAWAKQCYFAGRAMMEDALRPHGLGAAQWYVLHQLIEVGPTMQSELVRLLQVERATLSIIVATLVRKGLVEQVADAVDRRQKLLRATAVGATLWRELPDLSFIHEAAFAGISEADMETTARVLKAATERLNERLKGLRA